MKASITDLRYRMEEVLRAVDRGERVTVVYRGEEKARLMPIRASDNGKVRSDPAFGMWKHRKD